MPIITLILSLVPTILNSIPGISATIKQIITDITASATAVIGSGVISRPNANTILSAWLGVITALKSDTSLAPVALAQLAQLEKIVQSVLVQDAMLAKSVDWSKLQPITPVA